MFTIFPQFIVCTLKFLLKFSIKHLKDTQEIFKRYYCSQVTQFSWENRNVSKSLRCDVLDALREAKFSLIQIYMRVYIEISTLLS